MNLVLFEYRKVQESMGSAPFQLFYRRTVGGPMQILRHLWTGSDTQEEIKTGCKYVFELWERIGNTLRITREELEKA